MKVGNYYYCKSFSLCESQFLTANLFTRALLLEADPVSSVPVSSAVASVPALSVALPLFKRIHK